MCPIDANDFILLFLFLKKGLPKLVSTSVSLEPSKALAALILDPLPVLFVPWLSLAMPTAFMPGSGHSLGPQALCPPSSILLGVIPGKGL